jgi:hypothetical protein
MYPSLMMNLHLVFYFVIAASSRAVLVQITPLLGALVGVVVTLLLIAVCIIIFVRFKHKVINFIPVICTNSQ